ncbi:acylneuraminate cytidylyltransferase family protein [Pseudochryseolinea flava]|uniref:Acylneuraminate cytidylyltransferase family protein n=1 Tax=Pseudochryseolinea flava TaxID=2059302 RepID=A0A364XZI2_9BACT|nr:acylneuraminate cytidylyltransferase family protein [Pseudochryseolinea flava]RAV99750.1 hypothetical protein DQQ10_17030 [Pseudochryseolinea flava]
MKCLGIIPARKGSKRVPGKNTKLLNGVPLLTYALKACEESEFLTTIVVSSDDDDVLPMLASTRAKFLKRPDMLATDYSPAIDYVHHVLQSFSDESFDVIVIVQATTPFVRSNDIDSTIELLANDSTADSAVSVMKIEQLYHPMKLKTMRNNILYPYLTEEKGIVAAKDLPNVYVRNGGVYATRPAVIASNRIIGDTCLGFVMPSERSIDINEPIDFEFAEFIAKKYNF